VTFVVDYTYSLSGAMNVALLLLTRPNLLLFGTRIVLPGDAESSVMIEPKAVTDTQASSSVGRLADDDGDDADEGGWEVQAQPVRGFAPSMAAISAVAIARAPLSTTGKTPGTGAPTTATTLSPGLSSAAFTTPGFPTPSVA
jgi:hypothetical protein